MYFAFVFSYLELEEELLDLNLKILNNTCLVYVSVESLVELRFARQLFTLRAKIEKHTSSFSSSQSLFPSK